MLIGHLPELLVALVVLLVIIGPGKLPSLGGALGKSIREFKREQRSVSPNTPEAGLPEREAPRQR